jgi:adenosylcobinamide-phosphate synthase
MAMELAAAITAGFGLDLLLGDPRRMPHPVRLIGKGIEGGERFFRRLLPKSPMGEFFGGALLTLTICAVSFLLPWGLLSWAGRVHPGLRLGLEAIFCWQLIAARDLQKESEAVRRALADGDFRKARLLLSRIVGRDTAELDEAGVARAAVETVAENTSDGVVAPLFFLFLGGAALGFFYKAANTLDSMIGYKNERYLYFGRAAARLDDALNWIPARLSAFLMMAAAFLCGQDVHGAWRVWRRDRKRHASPNSAQTEAVCAGALGLRLAGDASYFGQVVHKPTIGDARRSIEAEDIARANRLMYMPSILALGLMAGLRRGAVMLF